ICLSVQTDATRVEISGKWDLPEASVSNSTDWACFHEGLDGSPSATKSMGDRFARSCMSLTYDCCCMVAIWPRPEKGSKVNAAPARAAVRTPILQSSINKFPWG